MLRFYYKDRYVERVDSLLAEFKGKSLRSPTRSTVPLLDMTLHASAKLQEIIVKCGAEPNSEFRFEYEVSNGVASARPSQTDLMVLGRCKALAIEAKWTEPMYENVAVRLGRRTERRKGDDSEDAVRRDREHQETEVGAWLSRLQLFASESLATASMERVVYQMVHRAASAVATGLSPVLLYLHFHDAEIASGATADDYKAELANLYEALGRPPGFPFYVADQPIERTPVFRSIAGLSKTENSTSTAVREALKAGPLFSYGPVELEKVA